MRQQFNNVSVRANFQGKLYTFRSKLEYRFAEYLESLRKIGAIKLWKYESKTFWFDHIRRGTVSYMPDFFVIEKDDTEIYYELKGYLIGKDITKFKRMAKYHSDINLILVMQSNRKKQFAKMREAQKYVKRILFATDLFRK